MSPKSRPGTKEKVLKPNSRSGLAPRAAVCYVVFRQELLFLPFKEFCDLTEEEEKMVKEWEETAKTVHGLKNKEEIERFVKDALRHHRETKHDSEK